MLNPPQWNFFSNLLGFLLLIINSITYKPAHSKAYSWRWWSRQHHTERRQNTIYSTHCINSLYFGRRSNMSFRSFSIDNGSTSILSCSKLLCLFKLSNEMIAFILREACGVCCFLCDLLLFYFFPLFFWLLERVLWVRIFNKEVLIPPHHHSRRNHYLHCYSHHYNLTTYPYPYTFFSTKYLVVLFTTIWWAFRPSQEYYEGGSNNVYTLIIGFSLTSFPSTLP